MLRRLRQARSEIPVIVLTARDSVTDTVAALEGGADDYMPKPFKFEELLARIRLRLRTRPGARGHRAAARPRRARPPHPAGVGRGPHGRPVGAGVRAGRDVPAQPRPGALAGATAQPRVGLRLRPVVQRRGRLRGVPAQEAGLRADPDRARHGLPAQRIDTLKPASRGRGSADSIGSSIPATSAGVGRPGWVDGEARLDRLAQPGIDPVRQWSGRQRPLRPAGAAVVRVARAVLVRERTESGCGIEQAGAETPHVAGETRHPARARQATAPGPSRRRCRSGSVRRAASALERATLRSISRGGAPMMMLLGLMSRCTTSRSRR